MPQNFATQRRCYGKIRAGSIKKGIEDENNILLSTQISFH